MNSLYLTKEFLTAKMLYLEGGCSVKHIARLVGISAKSVYRWVEHYKWDKARKNYAVPFDDIGSFAIQQILDIKSNALLKDRIISYKEAETISKLVKVICDCDLEISKPVTLRVLQQLSEYVAKFNPNESKKFNEIKEGFLIEMVNSQMMDELRLKSADLTEDQTLLTGMITSGQ